MKTTWLPFFIACIFTSFCCAQSADFTVPDTACQGKPVNITNVQPPSAISYKWSFCSGNAATEPDGDNIGNPNQLLNGPSYITLVQDGPDYYTFTTSATNSKIVRCFFGSSLTQFPLTITDLGNFGYASGQMRGIQVKKDNGVWYGFVANGNTLLRLVFGASLSLTPSAQVVSLNSLYATGLAITKEGTDWIGFFTEEGGNKLVRLDFGPSLGNNPLVTDLGNIGQLVGPTCIVLEKENSNWYAFICNIANNTLTRIEFGTSLVNPLPGGTNFANVSGLYLNAGITLINDCGGVTGFVTNMRIQSNFCIVHLVFKAGLGGPITGYHIPNKGVLNQPYGISEVVRQGDTLYAFVANFGSSSITRMYFPSCTAASRPFDTGPNPLPIAYADTGSYNIQLTVDDASSVQSSKCRKIVIIPKPVISLGKDRVFCQGQNALLDAGAGYSLYSWSTGAATRTITVDTTGTYWARVTNSGNCDAADTVKVTVKKSAEALVDTTICQGLSYLAQQALQTQNGIYRDTLKMVSGCDSIVTTNLKFEECPLLIWFPNAFTPNGDGVNDFFKPQGEHITKYLLQIYDRWGTKVFESVNINQGWDGTMNGRVAGTDVYTYDATFETLQYPGVSHRETGTFTLAR